MDTSLLLSPAQLEFQAAAYAFGQSEMLPFAAKWDAEQYFPGSFFSAGRVASRD